MLIQTMGMILKSTSKTIERSHRTIMMATTITITRMMLLKTIEKFPSLALGLFS